MNVLAVTWVVFLYFYYNRLYFSTCNYPCIIFLIFQENNAHLNKKFKLLQPFSPAQKYEIQRGINYKLQKE